VEETIAGINTVEDLWKDSKDIASINEDEMAIDKAQDFVKQMLELKWERMDCYWFQ